MTLYMITHQAESKFNNTALVKILGGRGQFQKTATKMGLKKVF